MDAVPALTLSLIAVFPGLMLYCAIYDVFCRRNNVVSTVPRDPKSVEALAVIILGSLTVHVVAVALSSMFEWPCVLGMCRSMHPVAVRSGEMILLDFAHKVDASRREMIVLATTTFSLGLITYGVTEQTLVWRAKNRALPYWLYRWTSTVAGGFDRDREVVLAYVLTTIEVDKKRVMYVGPVDDLALDDKFDIQRIALVACDRFLVNMTLPRRRAFGRALSNIPKLVIDAGQIANVSLERLQIGPDPGPEPDLLAMAMIRLYHIQRGAVAASA